MAMTFDAARRLITRLAMYMYQSAFAITMVLGAQIALPTQQALAQIACTPTPHVNPTSFDSQWNIDLNAGTCANVAFGVAAAADGIIIYTDDDSVEFEEVSVGGVFDDTLNSPPAALTANNIVVTPPTVVSAEEINSAGIYESVWAGVNNTNVTATMTMTLSGVNYTITLSGSFIDGTGHTITSMIVSGGVFSPANGSSTNSLVAQQATTQQTTGSNIMFGQTAGTVSTGIGNALSDAFFGGGAAPQIAPDGTAASGFVSTRSVGTFMQHARTHRDTDPRSATDAIDAAFGAAEGVADSDALPEGSPALAMTPAGSARSPQAPVSRFNVWVQGSYTHYDGDAFSGDAYTGVGGVDYRVLDTVLIGVVGGYEAGDFSFTATNGAFDGAGYTLGAYVGVKVHESIFVDASVTHTWLDYDNRVGINTGSTDASRWLFSLNATGQYDVGGGFTLEPNAKFFYGFEDQDAYTLSDGSAVAANDISSGRLALGSRLRYDFAHAGYAGWSTYASAHGEYDMSSEDVTNTLLPDFDQQVSARLGLGLDGTFNNGWMLFMSGDVGGLGTGDYTSYTGSARLRIPFN